MQNGYPEPGRERPEIMKKAENCVPTYNTGKMLAPTARAGFNSPVWA
jgi:hypothetical protein